MNACDFKRCLQSAEGEGMTRKEGRRRKRVMARPSGVSAHPWVCLGRGDSSQGQELVEVGGRGEMRDGVGGIMRKSKSWSVLGEPVFNQGRGIFVSRRWSPSGFQWGALVSEGWFWWRCGGQTEGAEVSVSRCGREDLR